MLDALKRLISRHPADSEWSQLAQWARSRKLAFKRVRDEEGFVIDGGLDSKPWRLEWGGPQRQYIEGHELRLRIDLGLSHDLQLLVLSQNLFETLERVTFDSFTETTQTVIDGNTPEEMRWLVMFPQASCKASKAVRARFHLVGSSPLEAANWFEGELAAHLEAASERFLKEQPPFMLMVLRGRVYLRMQLDVPDVESVSQALGVFETAVLQAIRTGTVAQGSGEEGDWSDSDDDASTAWQTQLGPEEGPGKGPGPH
jgi:hypothetical protein